ncbi:MAG: class I SAM-dependent methyltransferase [Bacteroidia bacterium]|nr:class I SAM-dependent methyltransferase [Bacteroidia bacterium]
MSYFSQQSSHYARNRPTYPDELFSFLSGLCKSHEVVWDCATGNGQAARSLSKYFKKVFATDSSPEQISRAFQKENIFYSVAPAEHSALENNSVDLVTVATAVHWFNIPEFYEEAERVLKTNGVLAVWGYAGCKINPEIDTILDDFAFNIILNYWRPETKLNWQDKYETINFPYKLIDSPKFTAIAQYNFDDLIHYLNSWSSVQSYKEKNNSNPVDLIYPQLEKVWREKNSVRKVEWDLFLKCGRKLA